MRYSACKSILATLSTITLGLASAFAGDPAPMKPQMELLWANLGSQDEATAKTAMTALEKTPNETVQFLKGKLRPVQVDETKAKQWIADLTSDKPDVRNRAEAELDYVAALIQTQLSNAMMTATGMQAQLLRKIVNDLAELPPVRGQQNVGVRGRSISDKDGYLTRWSWNQAVRGLTVLEHIGSADALAIVQTVAAGRFETLPTQAAEEILIRLGKAAPSPDAPEIHELFEAYRGAMAKHDIRKVYDCLTSELRDFAVFEAYFGCGMHPKDPKVVTVLKKFKIDEADINAEGAKRSRAKFGQKQPTAEEMHALMSAILLDKISDRVGFVVAADEALRPRDAEASQLSALKNIRVRGDAAIGETISRHCHFMMGPGNKMEKVWNDHSVIQRFKKTKDGWKVDVTDHSGLKLGGLGRAF